MLDGILVVEEEHANDMHDLLVAHEGRPMLKGSCFLYLSPRLRRLRVHALFPLPQGERELHAPICGVNAGLRFPSPLVGEGRETRVLNRPERG